METLFIKSTVKPVQQPPFDKWIRDIVRANEEKPDSTDFERRANELKNRLNPNNETLPPTSF